MSSEWVAVIVAVGLPIALRLLDWLLPKGHHWKAVSKYGVPDESPKRSESDDAQEGTSC